MNLEQVKKEVGQAFPILTAWEIRRPKMVRQLAESQELVGLVLLAQEPSINFEIPYPVTSPK